MSYPGRVHSGGRVQQVHTELLMVCQSCETPNTPPHYCLTQTQFIFPWLPISNLVPEGRGGGGGPPTCVCMSVHICNRENGITQAGRNFKQARELVYVEYISRWNYGTP
jgi:hypothetical protein